MGRKSRGMGKEVHSREYLKRIQERNGNAGQTCEKYRKKRQYGKFIEVQEEKESTWMWNKIQTEKNIVGGSGDVKRGQKLIGQEAVRFTGVCNRNYVRLTSGKQENIQSLTVIRIIKAKSKFALPYLSTFEKAHPAGGSVLALSTRYFLKYCCTFQANREGQNFQAEQVKHILK